MSWQSISMAMLAWMLLVVAYKAGWAWAVLMLVVYITGFGVGHRDAREAAEQTAARVAKNESDHAEKGTE